MKKNKTPTKLHLSRQTIRHLDNDLHLVAGGKPSGTGGFISALFPEVCTSSLPCSDRC